MKFFTLLVFSIGVNAHNFKVLSEIKKPLETVMVTQKLIEPSTLDDSDGGYPSPRKPFLVVPEVTRFTNASGKVGFERTGDKYQYRLRKFGHKDLEIADSKEMKKTYSLLVEEDKFKLAEQKSANQWLGALKIGSKEDKIIFKMQCGFCHQQGTSFTRQERSPEEWNDVIKRMVRYGSRLSSDLQDKLPEVLSKQYRELVKNPDLLENAPVWKSNLKDVKITEWTIGDSMSQTHDMLVHQNGLIYVADNIQDRLYELDPKTNNFTIYKVPHLPGDKNGGLIAGRMKDFPKHDSTSNAHSLTESHVDGHIFITPSAQQRLIEFDPKSKKFTIHQMDQGFYPHTIRMDHDDNVWFTLALSNQVAKFDRKKKTFKYYDLPARDFREEVITKNMKYVFKLIGWGVPLSNWLKIDRVSSGVPLVYGIDITPDGKVWVARLHTREIGVIDPKTDKIKMIKTPFYGPRRLRTDRLGNLWIGAFGESKIAKYDPKIEKFTMYDLPVKPLGSDTPYSLNVDKKRDLVWVNGNQSDSVYIFDIKKNKWTHSIPLPRKTTFTRDVEFAPDGSAYTANSNFPSWHIEDAQPTLIKIEIKN